MIETVESLTKPSTAQIMRDMALYSRTVPSGGALFAATERRDEKRAARMRVGDLFSWRAWPGKLSIMTMPGMDWQFERLLLSMREKKWTRLTRPDRTSITAIESDKRIFNAACRQIPGAGFSTVRPVRPYAFAEQAMKTTFATLFLANIDDFMCHIWSGGGWDAAWLDYTGPMTIERIKVISEFYHRFIGSTLIVTAMHGRWGADVSLEVKDAGSYCKWMQSYLPGETLHYIEYCDTAPMVQFAVRHQAPAAPAEFAGLDFWKES